MKNKLKHCINDMCIKHEQSNNSGCSKYFVDQDINTTDIDECPKYITNRPENKYKKMWDKLISEIIRNKSELVRDSEFTKGGGHSYDLLDLHIKELEK